MLDHYWGGAIRREARKPSRMGRRPQVESLEERALLAVALAPIAAVTVPATLGYQVPLNGSANPAPQTYTVTSSNPDVKATVAQGQFLTFTVSHNAATGVAGDVSFTGNITLQLFGDLTPNTVKEITQFVTSGFYVKTGKNFHRISSGFSGPGDFIVQGGSASGNGSGSSGQPGTPFLDEFNQQLAFTGQFQVAMANSGPNTNDTQFFFTTGSPQFLNFKHTIFGQVVNGQNIVQEMTQVATTTDSSGAKISPVSPVVITNAVLSNTNQDGVIHVDATNATAGETATVNVTAKDSATGGTTTQAFPVTVAADANAPERPFLVEPVPNQTVGLNQTNVFQIQSVVPTPGDPITYTVQGGLTTNTGTTGSSTVTFSAVQNAKATVDQSTGVVTVVPTTGFHGTINLLVGVRDQTNRSGSATLDDPSNYDYQQITLAVNSTSTPVTQAPIALPATQQVTSNTPATIQLKSNDANPGSPQTLTYALVGTPSHGVVSNFNPSTGSLTYTPTAGFTGTDKLQFTVANAANPGLVSKASTVTLNVVNADTGAVRIIGNVLVISPPVTEAGKANTIVLKEMVNATDATKDTLQVVYNGIIDMNQPLLSNTDRVVIFGAKGNDKITIDPSVDPTLPITLDGGHGGKNVLQGGAGPTREHGWFGRNTLIGGTGTNELIGRAGHVKFKPSSATDVIFASHAGIHPNYGNRHIQPPGGTYYRFVKGQLFPTDAAHTGAATAASKKTPAKTPHSGTTKKK